MIAGNIFGVKHSNSEHVDLRIFNSNSRPNVCVSEGAQSSPFFAVILLALNLLKSRLEMPPLKGHPPKRTSTKLYISTIGEMRGQHADSPQSLFSEDTEAWTLFLCQLLPEIAQIIWCKQV